MVAELSRSANMMMNEMTTMHADPEPGGKIVIAGGSGFLGARLAQHLAESECDVVVLSRQRGLHSDSCRYVEWDGRTLGPWAEHLNGAQALVNIAGRSVDCIKTPDHCDEILRSRVESTRVLGAAVRKVKTPPVTWVQMSTAHIYGDPPTAVCDEDSAFGFGLAPFVAQAWEAACLQSVLPEMRCVILRTSFVLGRHGGALKRLEKLARRGLGGTVGCGTQGMSWIHELDMNRLFTRAIASPDMAGIYVATSPNPVSNKVFMRELRRAIRQPIGLPAKAWMVRLGAPLLMKTDPELALYGRYCISRRLREEKFTFAFPQIGPALQDVLQTPKQ